MAICRDKFDDRNHTYIFDDGYAFGCREVTSETSRFNAALLLSLDGEPFDLAAGKASGRWSAAVVRPLLLRRLHAPSQRFLSLGISPNHPDFRPFGAMPVAPGFTAIDPALFNTLALRLTALHEGTLAPQDARDVFDAAVHVASAALPAPRALDPRVRRAMDRLEDTPQLALESLAAEMGLSYDRMSHLFSENMGLPMRSYQLSLKIHAAVRLNRSGMNLTDVAHAAGFSDSSHFSRVWSRAYGGSPSYLLGREGMRVQYLLRQPSVLMPQRSGAISVA